MINPYKSLPAHQFWRRSVSSVPAHLFDPVVATKFTIGTGDRVATAGSCFAQHISRKLGEIGFNYFVPESGEHLDPAARQAGGYGVYSARYGNIYTAAQLLQLHHEVYGERQPQERAWLRPDGRFIDPLRQTVEPDGYGTPEAVVDDRKRHLAAARRVFEECGVFVFTLGLTEGWRSKVDGTVLPLAPGVNGGSYDPERYEFVNFGVGEVIADLAAFADRLKARNPTVKMLVTVSPIPLMATYENRSVVTSTVYSKSVLRVAAEEVTRNADWIDYFPSYEIITSSVTGGLYYEPDLREVNGRGVAHAMRCFLNHYVAGERRASVDFGAAPAAAARTTAIVCDEEALDMIRV